LDEAAKDVFKEEFSYDAGRRRLENIIAKTAQI